MVHFAEEMFAELIFAFQENKLDFVELIFAIFAALILKFRNITKQNITNQPKKMTIEIRKRVTTALRN